MNIKILAQNIVNNPSNFTAEQIEKYFEDYAELRLSAVIKSVCCTKCKKELKPIYLCADCLRKEFG